MNAKERKTLTILQQHLGGTVTAQEAAAELAITELQFYRIKRRFHEEGDAGLVHRACGRPSNFSYAPMVRNTVLDLYRRKYPDYWPTYFAERLEVKDGYVIEHETLRRWCEERD